MAHPEVLLQASSSQRGDGEDAGNDGEQAIGKHVYAEGPGLSPTTSARAHVTNHYVGEAPDAVVNERTLLLVHINVV